MGWIGTSLCDMCGKRTENFAGKLILQGYKKKRGKSQEYDKSSIRTINSWAVCKTCLKKLSSIETIGDKIREELEINVDAIRVKYNKDKLLGLVYSK